MANKKSSDEKKLGRPSTTPEGRENQLIALAVNLAEEQLRNGTASSQVISHYLKLAANKERDKLEKELIEKKIELASAKTEAIAAEARIEQLYREAITAMRSYNGDLDESEEEL